MEFQTALAVEASNDIEYVSRLKERCSAIASQWHGALPSEIPVMPDVVLFQHFRHIAADRVAVGLSNDSIAPVVLPADNRLIIISGTEESGKTNMLRAVEQQLRGKQNTIYVDGSNVDEYERISAALRQASSGEQVTLLLDNFTQWLSSAEYDETGLIEELVKNLKSNRFSLYVAGDASEITQYGGVLAGKLIQLGRSILLGSSFNEHSSQFEANNLGYTEQGNQLEPYYGYLLQKKKAVKFKAVFAGRS